MSTLILPMVICSSAPAMQVTIGLAARHLGADGGLQASAGRHASARMRWSELPRRVRVLRPLRE